MIEALKAKNEVLTQLMVHQEIVTEAEREKSVLLEKVLQLEQMVHYECMVEIQYCS